MNLNPFYSAKVFFSLIIILSVLALALAFAAEFAFGLAPCQLCLYQRWPFAFAIGFAMIGRGGRDNLGVASVMSFLLALVFAGNSALAGYHSGVERKWWPSFLEGCTVSFEGDPETMLERIMAAPAVPCDAIPWADPLLGLSMANYNAAFCGGLAVMCLLAGVVFLRRS